MKYITVLHILVTEDLNGRTNAADISPKIVHICEEASGQAGKGAIATVGRNPALSSPLSLPM